MPVVEDEEEDDEEVLGLSASIPYIFLTAKYDYYLAGTILR